MKNSKEYEEALKGFELSNRKGYLCLDKWYKKHPLKKFRERRTERRYFKKFGLAPMAFWSTDCWFIDAMLEILIWYRYNRMGSPCRYADDENIDNCHEAWDAELDKVIGWLKIMKDYKDDCTYEFEEGKLKEYEETKNKLFSWMNEYLDDLWD